MIGARFDSPRQGVKVAIIEIKEDEPAVKEEKATKELLETTASANQSKSATEGKSKVTGGVTNKPVQKTNPTQPVAQKPLANPKPEEKVEVNPTGPATPPVEEDPPIDTSIEELEDKLPPAEYYDDTTNPYLHETIRLRSQVPTKKTGVQKTPGSYLTLRSTILHILGWMITPRGYVELQQRSIAVNFISSNSHLALTHLND